MESGALLDEDKVTTAVKASGLGMASFSQVELPVPESAYELAVSGLG